MISLRYHIVSIAAVFLSLAIGIVLGSTALSQTLLSGLSGQKEQLASQVADLQAKNTGLRAQLAADDRFAKRIGPAVVDGALTDRTVAIVTTPTASSQDRDAVVSLVKAAGGSVTTQIGLTSDFTDPANADRLRNLVTRLIPAGATLPTASDPGTLAGGLLGDLVLLDASNNKPKANPDEIAAAISGLTDGGFLQATGQVQPAQLAIVLTGGALHGDGSGDKALMVAHLATQMQRSGAGTVLAGATGSASGRGPVGVVRADAAATSILSTVDNVDTASGRIVTVLALRAQLHGHAGRFGVAGNAQAVMPRSGLATG